MPESETNRKTKAVAIDRRKLVFFRSRLLKWSDSNFASFPWRKTRNRFHALVAEVMLQRTKAEQVAPIFSEFVRRYPSPEKAAHDSPKRFIHLLKPLGLLWRAKTMRALVVRLASEKSTQIPSDMPRLLRLPGIGDYAASAFLLFHRRRPTLLIDANIVRLYGRFFGLETGPETRRDPRFRRFAQHTQPPNSSAKTFGYALLDFTRSVCSPKPHCDICVLRKMCSFVSLQSRP
jgi:A/G-specific adenine glycosylase